MSEYLKDWIKINNRDYQKKIANRDLLHTNSIELVDVMRDYLGDIKIVFEIGMGNGRNLNYLLAEKKSLDISGNDLSKECCFKWMPKPVKKVLKFYEIDSRALVDKHDIHADLVIVSDHIMHLDPQTAQHVIKKVRDNWKPTYVLIRETMEERLDKGVKKHIQDLSGFKTEYETLYREVSRNDPTYYVELLKRK